MDGGSQGTCIKIYISQKLKLQILGEAVAQLNTFGDRSGGGTTKQRRLVEVGLRSQFDPKACVIEAAVIPFSL